ncbi:ferritin family protein [Streptosporangium pseudovulgare]|uniref:Ferritin-like diiron domain-containing protein n=1 Tax=Streptosporangium pseudovulgare TaxID=35765 RepID=A0ABQ2RDI5_9ACTN|nr:ferritin family protein [Streptosporangium pseudovulgare]GGQ21199.1 hypothetical protein GCM10010140_59330 [Streptosporangium pseudovulgare]
MHSRRSAWRKTGAVVLGAAAIVAVPAGAAMAATAPRGDDLSPATRAHLNNAIQGEAFASAKYRAYAEQAAQEGLPKVRELFDRTADTELREHLTEQAKLTGLVGDNAANLRRSIGGESYEASRMYRGFAKQAKADGERKAARLFTEIGRDEAGHRARFAQALKAVTAPAAGVTVPTDVTVKPVRIKAGPPQVSARRTLENLRTALRGEALASAKYTLYADRARQTDQPELATLFDRAAGVERTEHFAEQAELAGLVRDTRTDLRTAVAGEKQEGERMYPGYARQAEADGDRKAAEVFADTARDELKHSAAFADALSGLQGQGSGAG